MDPEPPATWKGRTIDEIAVHVGSGVTPRGGERSYVSEGVPLLRSQNVHFGGLRLDDVARVPPDVHKEMSRSSVEPGDVLLNITGASIGRVCCAPPNLGPANVNQHVCIVRANRALADPGFLSAYLESHAGQSQIKALQAGLSREALNYQQVRAIRILLPPLPEQRKIAAILSSADETVEKTEAVIERLDVVKKAMLEELLTRGMPGRHSRFKETEIGVVPEGWGLTPLGDAGRWMSGGTPSKGKPELWQGSIPWVSPKDMKRARISDAIDHVSESAIGNGTALVPAGAILIVVRGMILAHSAPVAITQRPVCFNQDMKALIPHDNLLPEFVLYWMQAREEALLRTVDVANHGTKRMPSELLFALPLPVPEPGEQRDICAALDAVDARLAAEGVTLQRLERTKRCLSAQLLSGEIRVSP